jgi:hypothetical protein
MAYESAKDGSLWIPGRTFGVCVWIMPDGKPLSDSDGNYLSAEGLVGDSKIEKLVAEGAKYWSGSDEGQIFWIHGARKVSDSERQDQVERLNNGLIPDPYEDFLAPMTVYGKNLRI